MKDFKFFEPDKQIKVFNLNVLGNPLGRVPSYNVYVEPYEFEQTMEVKGSIRDIITGLIQVPMVFNGMVITRVDGSHTEINYQNVDRVNQRGLLFDINDRLIIRHRV
jgi:hypothetical protein